MADFVPDVIETHHIWIMGYILKRLGQKFIAVAHNSDQIGYRYDERMQPYAMSCANGADTIFAVSDFVRDEVLDLYQVPSEKVVTVENGFNETIFSPQTIDKKKLFDEYGISVDPNLPIVTFGGKLSRTKGVDTLIEANRLLQGEVPFHLVLFGVGDLEEVLGHPPTDDEMKHVTLMGHLPQSVLARFHNVARLSTVPSRFEGFNIAALEAMGCGLPVVGTRTGQIEKFVVGEIVEAADSEALAGAIKKILTMPDDEYVKLSKRATDVAANYSWPGNVQKRLLYYDGVSA